MWRTPTEIGTRQRRASLCSLCGKAVQDSDKAINCDVCDTWEHQNCVRQADRLSEELYQNITLCNSKSIVYVCTGCREKGSLGKRLLKCEFESARNQAGNCWPANVCSSSGNEP